MKFSAVPALCLLLSGPAFANDTFVTLGAGGLVPQHTAQVAMESEELQISPEQITIHYHFRNSSDKDVDAIVAFPLPDLDGGDVANAPMSLPADSPNFVDFSAAADGRPVTFQMDARAYQRGTQPGNAGHEVTEELRAAGLAIPYVMLNPLNAELLRLSQDKRAQLEKKALIIPETGFNPPLRSTGKTSGWWANWILKVQFYWTQHFPAGKTVELVQNYKPVVGGSYIPSGDAAPAYTDYCSNAETAHAIKDRVAHHMPDSSGIAFYERTIDYILTTANNWNGPIGHFHLTVATGSPGDILMTCMPGLKRIAPGRYELTRENFRPESDLKLLILQTARPREIDGR